jgi:glycosyltransferase involved in cell wall biosynthesis
MASLPLVSICVPSFNSARWILETLDSALRQTYPEVEILVVDNASTDDTVALARSTRSPRLRVEVNGENLGAVRNFNRCIDQARGELIKFLLSDDLLYPACVERMAGLFARHGTLGLVFSPRDVLLDEDADNAAREWKRQAETLHTRFNRLETVNSGRSLFEQYLEGELYGNWIGEPTCVMVRKECFRRVGGFNPRICQEVDYAMWLRVLAFFDAGFLDERLSAYRVHSAATTASNKRINRDWLDRLWLLEDLLSYEEIRRRYPQIRRLRNRELRRLVRAEVGGVVRGLVGARRPSLSFAAKARAVRDYLAYRAAGRPMLGAR